MTNLLTQEEVRVLCRRAGFTRGNAKIGSAIAMCESAAVRDGKPFADFDLIGDQELANTKWGFSYGGFQIRSLRSQAGTGGVRDAERLLNPTFNVASAKAIKLSQGWKAWSVFTSGAYKAYLQDIYPPAPNTYIVTGGDTLSSVAAALGLDWEDLARWNNLHAPYTIYIGQILLLENPVSV